jgi:hypothetical protein
MAGYYPTLVLPEVQIKREECCNVTMEPNAVNVSRELHYQSFTFAAGRIENSKNHWKS